MGVSWQVLRSTQCLHQHRHATFGPSTKYPNVTLSNNHSIHRFGDHQTNHSSFATYYTCMIHTYPMIKMYVSQGPVQFRSLLLCFDICLRTPDSEDWNLMQSSEFCIFSMLVEYRPNWCSFDWWMIFSPADPQLADSEGHLKVGKVICMYLHTGWTKKKWDLKNNCFHSISLLFLLHYWALLGPTRPYWALLGPTRPYWALPGLTRPYLVSQLVRHQMRKRV